MSRNFNVKKNKPESEFSPRTRIKSTNFDSNINTNQFIFTKFEKNIIQKIQYTFCAL